LSWDRRLFQFQFTDAEYWGLGLWFISSLMITNHKPPAGLLHLHVCMSFFRDLHVVVGTPNLLIVEQSQRQRVCNWNSACVTLVLFSNGLHRFWVYGLDWRAFYLCIIIKISYYMCTMIYMLQVHSCFGIWMLSTICRSSVQRRSSLNDWLTSSGLQGCHVLSFVVTENKT
jgi:hypothetical protein